MAFSKTMQKMWDRFIEAIDRIEAKGKKFDLIKMGKALDVALVDMGLHMKSPQWIKEVFDELSYPRSNWEPTQEDLQKFFNVLPERMKKENITKDILVKYVPKNDWGKYDKAWAESCYSFIESCANTQTTTIANINKDKYSLSFYLGDLSDSIPEELASDYDVAYDAVEDMLGKEKIIATINKFKPDSVEIKLVDWPNLSCITNAKYEFEVDKKYKKADVENWIDKSFKRIGII